EQLGIPPFPTRGSSELIGDRLVEPRQHRLPVGYRRVHLGQDVMQSLVQRFTILARHLPYGDVDDADLMAFGIRAHRRRIAEDLRSEEHASELRSRDNLV